MNDFTIEMTIKNQCGALNRITSLYAKRRFEIKSMYMRSCENPDFAVMKISSSGDERVQNQALRQLNKLYDVMNVRVV